MAIFQRVGISPILMLKFKGWPDWRLIEFLNSTLAHIEESEREKIKEAIRLISERALKRATKEKDRLSLRKSAAT